MIINDFGVPMNEAELSMHKNPAKVMLHEQLATSGMEMQWVGVAVGMGVSAVGGMIGGSKSASAAREQAELQNQATHARYQYDLDQWDMKRSQLNAERMEAVDRIKTSAINEGKIRAYKDAANATQYAYDLQIRDAQQASNEAAYKRSETIYEDTTNINSSSARMAMDSRIVKSEEAQDQAIWDRNEAYLEMIQAEGKLRAKGVSGRSAAKGIQSTLADYGKQMALLNAASDSSGRNTRAVLNEIIHDKTSADLTAYAAKMLEPGVLPKPIKAEPIPIPDIDFPRALMEYDFGPQPIKGAMASPSAAANRAWGSAITSIAGNIGTGLSASSGNFAGSDW